MLFPDSVHKLRPRWHLANGGITSQGQGRALTLFYASGRELGSYALEEYTSVKAIHWNYGEKLDWPL